jgi:hypothetical protein
MYSLNGRDYLSKRRIYSTVRLTYGYLEVIPTSCVNSKGMSTPMSFDFPFVRLFGVRLFCYHPYLMPNYKYTVTYALMVITILLRLKDSDCHYDSIYNNTGTCTCD